MNVLLKVLAAITRAWCKLIGRELEDARWHEKVDGGYLIEDDGGFVNFISTDPTPSMMGMCIGFGMEDDDEMPPESKNNVIEVDFSARRRKVA